jgi:hypothetical protein
MPRHHATHTIHTRVLPAPKTSVKHVLRDAIAAIRYRLFTLDNTQATTQVKTDVFSANGQTENPMHKVTAYLELK